MSLVIASEKLGFHQETKHNYSKEDSDNCKNYRRTIRKLTKAKQNIIYQEK